jgi:RNA polymerase sigma factor (sigma-70 family)
VNRFSRYVYAITSRAYRLGVHDAEDVFQEVFARTYASLDELRDDAAVRPWIGTLTRRLCVDRLRDAAREQASDDALDPTDAADMMAELDEALTVQEALRNMDPDCAEILDRFFTRDQSYRAIGDALGLPSGTIASRISRCLRKLRMKLEGRKPRFEPSSER